MPNEKVEGSKPVDLCQPRMKYVPIKPMPEDFWRLSHPVLQAIRLEQKRLPRNVTGYHIQDLPDGCHNCKHLYCGAPPDLQCAKACRNPDKPCLCDSVNVLGKCADWKKFEFQTTSIPSTTQQNK